MILSLDIALCSCVIDRSVPGRQHPMWLSRVFGLALYSAQPQRALCLFQRSFGLQQSSLECQNEYGGYRLRGWAGVWQTTVRRTKGRAIGRTDNRTSGRTVVRTGGRMVGRTVERANGRLDGSAELTRPSSVLLFQKSV